MNVLGETGANYHRGDTTIDGELDVFQDAEFDQDVMISGDLDVTGALELANINATTIDALDGTGLTLRQKDNIKGITVTDGSGVELYHNDNKRFHTTTFGNVQTTNVGTITTTGATSTMQDITPVISASTANIILTSLGNTGADQLIGYQTFNNSANSVNHRQLCDLQCRTNTGGIVGQRGGNLTIKLKEDDSTNFNTGMVVHDNKTVVDTLEASSTSDLTMRNDDDTASLVVKDDQTFELKSDNETRVSSFNNAVDSRGISIHSGSTFATVRSGSAGKNLILESQGSDGGPTFNFISVSDISGVTLRSDNSAVSITNASGNFAFPTNLGSTSDVLQLSDPNTLGWVAPGTLSGSVDHSSLLNLTVDTHTQYPLSIGRTSGQTLIGGIGASEHMTLQSTSDVTRGEIKVLDNMDLNTKNISSVDRIYVGSGTQSLPAYTFTSDTGTGMYRVSAGRIRLCTQGVQRIDIQSGSITFREPCSFSSGLTVDMGDTLSVDTIVENTLANGVDIDGCKVKDNTLTTNTAVDLDLQRNSISKFTLGATQNECKQDLDMNSNNIVGFGADGIDLDVEINTQRFSSSTGVHTGGVLSIGTPNTTFSITDGDGSVYNDTTNLIVAVTWASKTNIAVTNIGTQLITFVSIDSGGNVIQRTNKLTNTEFTQEIYLGVIVHTDLATVNAVNIEAAHYTHCYTQLANLMRSLGFINQSGNVFTAAVAGNLKFDKSTGVIIFPGVNYNVDSDDPNDLTLGALTDIKFQYRYQDGSNRLAAADGETDIRPGEYDDGNGAGVPGAVPSNKYTVQRVYLFTSNLVKIQPGQQLYNSITLAEQGIENDPFVVEPSILANGVFRAYLIVKGNATDLTDDSEAMFLAVGKFGTGSTVSGLSVSSLQDAYENTVIGSNHILTDTTQTAVKLQRGTGADTDNVLEVRNGADSVTVNIAGNGNIMSTGTISTDLVDARTASGLGLRSLAGAQGLLINNLGACNLQFSGVGKMITTASGVSLSGDIDMLSNDIKACNSIDVDTINEKTATNGVTIDGVLLKDAGVIIGTGETDPTLEFKGTSTNTIVIPDAVTDALVIEDSSSNSFIDFNTTTERITINKALFTNSTLNMDGSTLRGSNSASGNLLLESTANAAKGDVQIVTGSDLDINSNNITNATSINALTVSGGILSGGDLILKSTTHATKGVIIVEDDLQLNASTSGSVTIKPAATTTAYTLTMPNAQSTASDNQVLVNDGTGALSWVPYVNILTITPADTLTLGDGTNNFTLDGTLSHINYWTLGDTCYLHARLRWTSKGSASGTIRASLPIAMSPESGNFCVGYAENITFSTQLVLVGSTSSRMFIEDLNSASAPTILTDTAFGTSGYLNYMGFYCI